MDQTQRGAVQKEYVMTGGTSLYIDWLEEELFKAWQEKSQALAPKQIPAAVDYEGLD